MADVFEDRRDLDAVRLRLWALIEATPSLDWLLLTKRPENFAEMLPATWLVTPRPNVWLGTTLENHDYEHRVWDLLAVPAAVHFLSCEPLLGPVDISPFLVARRGCDGEAANHNCIECSSALTTISWVVVGGESGGGARPFAIQWARSIVQQCRAAGTAVFVKQLGARPVDLEYETGTHAPHDKRSIAAAKSLGMDDGYVGLNLVQLKDRKGGDMLEWPSDLRAREFPETKR
jgi:protein gp37